MGERKGSVETGGEGVGSWLLGLWQDSCTELTDRPTLEESARDRAGGNDYALWSQEPDGSPAVAGLTAGLEPVCPLASPGNSTSEVRVHMW